MHWVKQTFGKKPPQKPALFEVLPAVDFIQFYTKDQENL